MSTANRPDSKKHSLSYSKDEGKIWPQILAILIVSVTPLTSGIFFSWSSPFIVKITNDKENYDISEEEASYFPVIPPIAMIVTSLLFSNLNDILGRKSTILITTIPYTISWILAAVARSVWLFYASRVVSGIGDGLMYSSVPMYIGEISTPKVRGIWGNALIFSIYMGQFLIHVIGSYFNVSQTSYICMSFLVVPFILFSFIPESPYFYVMKGKFEEAKTSLRRLTKKDDIEEDFKQLMVDVERQMSETGTWKDLFMIVSNRKALYAGTFLRIAQQLSGFAAFAVYAQYIFLKSGGNLSPEVSSMIFFGSISLMNLVGAYTLDKFGRKRSCIVSSFVCGLAMLTESVYFYIDEIKTEIDIKFLNWIPISGMMVYVVFYSIGIGILPTLMLGELFSASIKAKGLGALAILFGILICSISKLFYTLSTSVGMFSPFLLFAANCFVSTVLAHYLVPETKGKTLEEIQQALKQSQQKRKKGDIEHIS